MVSVPPIFKGVEILLDGSVVRTGTNYSGKSQEAHDASKASIQSRISNLESGGVKGTGEAIGKINIPSIRNGEFNKWFDELSSKEFNKMWEDPKLRKRIEDRIRRPGGYHEWHLVARTPKFKEWEYQ